MLKKLKLPVYLVITIFLTLGFSISLQSLLASWTPPTANPAGSNVKMPIYNANTLLPADPIVDSDLTVTGNVGAAKYCDETGGACKAIGDLGAGFWEQGLAENDIYRGSGNVGIGTNNPQAKLDVIGGSIRLSADQRLEWGTGVGSIQSDALGNITVRSVDGFHSQFISGSFRPYFNNSIDLGYPGQAWKNAYISGEVAANSFMYSSDLRLKDNIEELENPLDKILNMRGVSFEFKGENEKKAGFVAQEVEKIIPEIVDTNETTGLKSVEYGNLNAYLVEAIKELNEEVKRLKTEINELKK